MPAAAELNFALKEIAEQFGRARGLRVVLIFGCVGDTDAPSTDGAHSKFSWRRMRSSRIN